MSDAAKSEDLQPAASSGEARPEPPAAPRLGVIHLLLWMAGSAVLLFFFRSEEGPPGEPRTWQVFREAVHVAQSMIYGAAVAAFSLFHFYGRRFLPYPSQPGHWLLLLLGIDVIVRWGLSLFEPEMGPDVYLTEIQHWLVVRNTAWMTVPLVVLIVAGVSMYRNRNVVWGIMLLGLTPLVVLDFVAWMIEFEALPGLNMFITAERSFPFPIVLTVYYTRATLSAVGIATACIVDVATRTRRDWAHWVGAASYIHSALAVWCWQVRSLLNFLQI